MNDPSKNISVNLSSLHSLKAELLRKQAEVNRTKSSRMTNSFIPKKLPKNNVEKCEQVNTITESNELKIYECEDSALLEKSRRTLEAKSKYYTKMAKMGGQLNSDDNCLVLFNHKKQEQKVDISEKSDEKNLKDSSDDDGSSSSSEEYIEYTDYLGRCRKILKTSLEDFRNKDKELIENMRQSKDQPIQSHIDETPRSLSPTPSENFSTISKHDEMRMNWDRTEEENILKENVHYQDVFFDEARQHGVGYYAFSTDDDERTKQQKELEEIRKKTMEEQKQRNAIKKYRENIIAERVKAAKNRQRARAGLPPIEDDVEDVKAEDPIEIKKLNKQRKLEAKEKRRMEKEEKRKEKERVNHVRPWDRKKDGVNSSVNKHQSDDESEEWKYIPEKTPMSQEQWNELKRSERLSLFAPPPIPEKKSRTNYEKHFVQPFTPQPIQDISESQTYASSSFAQFQTTKRKGFQKRNYTSGSIEQADTSESNQFRGAMIPPPSNMDDYKSSKFSCNEDLEASIEAGLNYIRNKSDKETLSSKSSWTAKTEY